MKCEKCGNEFDTSTAPANCPRCGNKLPCAEVILKVREGEKLKEIHGRIMVDGEKLLFVKQKLSQKQASKMVFGLVGAAIIGSVEKAEVLSFMRSDFTDIKRVDGQSGRLLYYELSTQNEVYQVFPTTRNTLAFESEMDSYINLTCSYTEEEEEKTSEPEIISTNNNDKKNSNSLPVEALEQLKELHESGVLTDEEYTKKKKQILGI